MGAVTREQGLCTAWPAAGSQKQSPVMAAVSSRPEHPSALAGARVAAGRWPASKHQAGRSSEPNRPHDFHTRAQSSRGSKTCVAQRKLKD